MSSVLQTFYGDLNKLKLNQFPCGSGKWRLERDPGYVDQGEVTQETLFSLEELANCQVFNVKSDWSEDIVSLRQLAVQKPHLICENFIFQHFSSLKLLDRNIDEVDKGLLRFTNLRELSLTGNSLTSVLGANLPRSLTCLQLFANRFTELEDLTVNPPPNLHHLGVGFNKLSDISSYITPKYWPRLLSLDLSNNKIAHLKPTLTTLAALPALRNLSLMANPISLTPGYVGCTLDLLPDLRILDDVSISDDDRLHFTGISGEEFDWDQAIFTVTFPVLENLRQPPDNEPLDEANFLYPVQKKYSYFIRFNFVSDTPPTPLEPLPRSTEPELMTPEPPEPGLEYNTEHLEWADNLTFGKVVVVKCSDLGELEEFLGGELKLRVVEKVVETFTTIAPPDTVTPTPTPSANKKKGKDDKKKKKDEGGKVLKDKEGNILKWVESAPTFTEIAHIRAKLKPLLQGSVTTDKKECVVTERLPATTPPPEDGRQSSCSAKGGKGGKKGGKGKKVPTPVPVTPPQPLKIEYKVDKVKWGSVAVCRQWLTE